MSDLFTSGNMEHLPLTGGELSLWHDVIARDEGESLLQTLIEGTEWQQNEVRVWGKLHKQPRLVCWFGDEGQPYSYSGITLQPKPWTPTLTRMRRIVEQFCSHTFNSVLLNYYRDQRDGMGFHSDNEIELGPEPAIASLSLGATRAFVMKHRVNKQIADVRIPLEDRSLLLMTGATQKNWKHGIPKESRLCGPRVNLTFRKILN